MFRQITRCNPAILSITFLHDEDMQPFDPHGKKCMDMIVQMDAIGRKKGRWRLAHPSTLNGPVERSCDAGDEPVRNRISE